MSPPRLQSVLSSRSLFRLLLMAGALGCVCPAGGEETLRTALSLRSLSPEDAAKQLPVELRGTVVFIEGPDASIVIQDDTAGTYFLGQNEHSLRPGDEVVVTGVTTPGTFLPGIGGASYEKLGHRELPPGIPATYADFASGRHYFQRVVVEGIVHEVKPSADGGRAVLSLAMEQDLLEVRVCAPLHDQHPLVDSRVRIECLASGGVNQRRQLVRPIAWMHDWSGLHVVGAAPLLDEVPLIPGSRLLAFEVTGQGGHRVRVAGEVLAAFPDGDVFLRDDSAALHVRLSQALPLNPGTKIEAVGFPKMQRFSASLVGASLVKQEAATAPQAVEVGFSELLNGGFDHELVTVAAELSGHFQEENGQVLVLQEAGRTLRVQAPPLDQMLPRGARVSVIGICRVESNTSSGVTSTPRTVSLRSRTVDDVRLLSAPSWWSARRLALAVGVLLLLVAAAGLWIVALRLQVRRQTRALRRQIEHEAALEERQRIAREFHDTLEQGLTGLALRLETVQARGTDEKSGQLLRASRGLVSQIHEETRSLVSSLRRSSRDGLNLVDELKQIVAEYPAGAGPALECQAEGALPDLPSHSVHHLKMIAREAVTNAIKHAGATCIRMTLGMKEDHLRLCIADDGCGFDPSAKREGQSGQFGCIGIEERCEKLDGSARWRSGSGGTTLEVLVPAASVSANAHPA